MSVGAGGRRGVRRCTVIAIVVLAACSSRSLVPAASPAAASAPATGAREDAGVTARTGSATACAIAPESQPEPLTFDWNKVVVRSASGWIAALAADGRGVLVAGGDSSERNQWAPFVAAFALDGSERYRILLDKSARSSTKPPRAAAVAIARTPSGTVYVLSTAAQTGSPTSVTLTLLEADGRQRFTVPVDLFGQAQPALHADSQGHAIVAGIREPGGRLGVLKFADDGTLLWSKTYRYEGDIPRLAEVGDRLLLAGSFHGSVDFGNVAASHTTALRFSCGTGEARCEAKGNALVVAELDAAGEAVRARTFGAPAASITLSGLAARPDGRSVLTGEFQGPNVVLGSVSLCEREPGMPPADATGFQEREGAFDACSCRKDRRDLFALELGADLTPRWAKTLATGRPQPRIAWSAAAGGLVWAAHTSRSAGEDGGELSLWQLDSDGAVTSRRSAPGPFSELTVTEEQIAYLSDRKRVMRATLAKRMP